MSKKRLLHISHDLQIGGLQQVIVNLCKYTDKSIFDMSVLCLRTLGPYAEEVQRLDVPVFLIAETTHKTDYFLFRKIGAFLREHQIDIIHTHNTQPFIDGVLGSLFSRRRHQIIHTDHARHFPDKRRYMLAEWALSHVVTKVVGVSEHTSKNLIQYERISPRRIATFHNGIDPAPFRGGVDRECILSNIGVTARGPLIGLGVRLAEQKGITYLLQAMPAILASFPELSLVIAGEGELEHELKEEASALGIQENVFFVGPRLDMPDILKVLDLYVLPSLWEGLPMVLLEAMAAGCPIVATDVGGNSLAVRDGVNGELVKPKDPEALATRVVGLLKDAARREAYKIAGWKLFEAEFTADIMARRYEELYLSDA